MLGKKTKARHFWRVSTSIIKLTKKKKQKYESLYMLSLIFVKMCLNGLKKCTLL